MTNNESNWKKLLLKSGMPLEYAASAILVRKEFLTRNEYIFSRTDQGISKDFSIDIRGIHYVEGKAKRKVDRPVVAGLTIFAECKYRNPSTKWLFFPEPNNPEFSPLTYGRTIRCFDQFSNIHIPSDATAKFDQDAPMVFGGVEIQEKNSNEGFTAEIRRGLSQLQYGLLRHFRDEVTSAINEHPDDRIPFFCAPILVTTAEIHVLKKNINLEDIERSTSIEDVATRVPWCVVYKDYGTDFEVHARETFGDIPSDINQERFKALIDKRSEMKLSRFHSTPQQMVKWMQECSPQFLGEYCTQFIVCDFKNFEALIESIIRMCKKKSTLEKSL